MALLLRAYPIMYSPAVSVAAGAFIYVASETTGFTQWMGFAPNFVNAVANNNGDDAVLLFQSGSVVDVYGVPGVDGTGQSWKQWMDGGTGIQVAVQVRFTFHLNGATAVPMHSMIPM